jgi:hypothetical protein
VNPVPGSTPTVANGHLRLPIVPGDHIKIVGIDQVGSEHAATVTLGASPVA